MDKYYKHYGPEHCGLDHDRPEHCGPDQGWPEQGCADQTCSAPHHNASHFPVPPPIPPVRYEPGLNVQDQLVNMAQRVNVSIHRWNEIQANCYAALNRVVGAAVDNSVYYNECDVRCMTGFDSASGCTYNLVQIKHRDRAGQHIKVALLPAYQNVTNSGAVENIETASFVQSAQCIISAVPYDATRWEGPMVYKCMPGSSSENDNTYVAGFTGHGVLRVFPGNVTPEILLQNGIRDAIGPVTPLVQDGEVIAEGDTVGSVQAIAYRACDKMTFFFSCGCVKAPGMSPVQVANVFKSLNVTTAVMTSLEEPSSTSNTHAGMLYMGKNSSPTVGFKVPSGIAFWYVSKPMRKNEFEAEISSIVQNMGANQNAIENLMGGLDGMDLNNLQDTVEDHIKKLQQIDTEIQELSNQLNSVQENITSLENRITNVEVELATEAETREQADTELSQRLNAEIGDRENADTQMENALQQETNQRIASDNQLQNQINDLKSGTALPTATRTRKGVIIVGDNLTIDAAGRLSAEPGVDIKAGTGITVDKVGKINTISVSSDIPTADDISSLQDLVQDAVDKATVADQAAKDAQDATEALASKVTANEQVIAEVEAGKVNRAGDTMTGQLLVPSIHASDLIETGIISSPQPTLNFQSVSNLSHASDSPVFNPVTLNNIASPTDGLHAANKDYVDKQTQAITDAVADGSALPIATTEKAGIVRVGANLSISPDGTLSASPGGESAGNDVTAGDGISVSVDETSNVATVSLNQATKDAIAAVADKADKTTVTALESTVNAHKEIIDDNTQNIDAVSTTVGTVSADVEKLKTNLASLNDTATEAMRTATDAETKAVAAQADATQAKTDAASALTEAGQALEEVTGKVSKTGDTMSGTLMVPEITLSGTRTTSLSSEDAGGEALRLKVRGHNMDVPNGVYFGGLGGATTGALTINAVNSSANFMPLPVFVATPTKDNHAVPLRYLQNKYLPLTGGTMTGILTAVQFTLSGGPFIGTRVVGNNKMLIIEGGTAVNEPVIRISNVNKVGYIEFTDSSTANSASSIIIRGVKEPVNANDAANKAYVDSKIISTATFMPKTGGTFTGQVYGQTPTASNSLATKSYVDGKTTTISKIYGPLNAGEVDIVFYGYGTHITGCLLTVNTSFTKSEFEYNINSPFPASKFGVSRGGLVDVFTVAINGTNGIIKVTFSTYDGGTTHYNRGDTIALGTC